MRILLLLLALLLSCAPKLERRCEGDKVLTEFSSKYVPKDFRIYGFIKYGPLKFPMMLAKFDGFYTVKVAGAEDVSMDRDRLCIGGRCYLLPVPPEYIVFGKLLNGREFFFCKNDLLLFRERQGVYEKLVVFSEGKPREISVRNVKNGKVIRIVFGPMDERGYFREIEFLTGSESAKLIVEGVQI